MENENDGKIYKNPRNSPSTLCPRDEEQATLLVCTELCKYLKRFWSFVIQEQDERVIRFQCSYVLLMELEMLGKNT